MPLVGLLVITERHKFLARYFDFLFSPFLHVLKELKKNKTHENEILCHGNAGDGHFPFGRELPCYLTASPSHRSLYTETITHVVARAGQGSQGSVVR